jgi:dethiobiotin synthetase
VGRFITGTDTGVGKTYTLTHLLRLLRSSGLSCEAMKPICCRDRHAAEVLLAANGGRFTIDEIKSGPAENSYGAVAGCAR